MPVRYLSDPDLAQLSSWPDEIAVEDAVTYFTLSAEDLRAGGLQPPAEPPGRCRSTVTLPWLGWVPDDLAGCPRWAQRNQSRPLGPALNTVGKPFLMVPLVAENCCSRR